MPTNNSTNTKHALLGNMLLKLPLGLIICATAFYYAWSDHLFHPDVVQSSTVRALRAFLIISLGLVAPLTYVLWLSFCFILFMARLDMIAQFKIPFFEFSTVLACFIPVMWLWFWVVSMIFQLRRIFKHIIDTALALEAWWWLGIFIVLLVSMTAIFLKGYLLMLYSPSEESEAEQSRARYFKDKFLCFATAAFTTVIIVYI